MNLVSALLYPIALLLPATGAIQSDSQADEVEAGLPSDSVEEDAPDYIWPDISPQVLASEGPLSTAVLANVEPGPAWQVHIEQRMEIRITPRAASPAPPDMFVGIPTGDLGDRFSERKIGKCVSITGIAGVQPNGGSRLLLYMRDRRLIAADLERSCRARDFYSGFYLARTPDGQLCIDRDALLSRSGMNCRLTRIRQLVERDR